MSNIFDSFDGAGASSSSDGNVFDQFDSTPKPDAALAAQWASAGPMDRLRMMAKAAPATAAKVDIPILKDMAQGAINTVGTAGGATLGGMAGGVPGAMGGAALGNYGAQRANVALGLQDSVSPGQVAGAGLTAGGSGPISAPLAATLGGTAQSLMEGRGVPSAAQLALMAVGGEMAAGEPMKPTGAQITKDATLAEGQAAGYVLPPNEVNPSTANNILGSVGGKADLKAASKIKNQQTTNTLAAKAIGLDPSQPITAQAIQGVKDSANQAYAQVAALSPSAAGALEDLKQARFDAKANYQFYARNADPSVLKTAQKASEDAEIYEQLLEDEASKQGNPALVNNLRQARVTLAKAHVVDTALNEATGNISAPIIGRMFDKGKPLTGELGTIGKFQQAHPLYMGEAEGTAMPGVSKLSIPEAAGAAYIGHEKFGTPGLAAGILPFTPPIARGALLSSPYQRFFGRPTYDAPPPGLAANLARFTGQQAALSPNLSLLQPTQ